MAAEDAVSNSRIARLARRWAMGVALIGLMPLGAARADTVTEALVQAYLGNPQLQAGPCPASCDRRARASGPLGVSSAGLRQPGCPAHAGPGGHRQWRAGHRHQADRAERQPDGPAESLQWRRHGRVDQPCRESRACPEGEPDLPRAAGAAERRQRLYGGLADAGHPRSRAQQRGASETPAPGHPGPLPGRRGRAHRRGAGRGLARRGARRRRGGQVQAVLCERDLPACRRPSAQEPRPAEALHGPAEDDRRRAGARYGQPRHHPGQLQPRGGAQRCRRRVRPAAAQPAGAGPGGSDRPADRPACPGSARRASASR